MTCSFSEAKIEETIIFHGHSCPGLAIGIRAAECALSTLTHTPPASLICVTETDMCGVDGIQYLTGCTLGKGNLIHLDYGKMAFSFFDTSGEVKGIRVLFHLPKEELSKEDMITRIMTAELSELFSVAELDIRPPRAARVLTGLKCEECGETTMESRTRRFAGQTLCIPCFTKVEQKI